MPGWVFWFVVCATAVATGLVVAYFGSPQSVTPLESSITSTTQSASPAQSSDAPTTTEVTPEAATDDGVDSAAYEGVGVQVLNASSEAAGATEMAERLERAGLEVQIVETAQRIYTRTTVFWTPRSGRAAAEALAERYGWVVQRKPANLTSSVPVHVVVGEDAL